MKNFDEILAKALAGDGESLEKIRSAILSKTLTHSEIYTLFTTTEGNILDNSYALFLRGAVFAFLPVTGFSQAQCLAEAINLFDKSILLKNPHAMHARATMYSNGKDSPENYAKAIRLFDQAILLGNSYAMYNRAIMYNDGKGGPRNYAEAIRLFDQAILLGNSHAMYGRAHMHHKGKGGSINYAEAIRLLDQAILLENSLAMQDRALMHYSGHGGPVNYAEAIRLYDQAILLGNSLTMYNRALMHHSGHGGPVNYAEAAHLYRKCFEQAQISKDVNVSNEAWQSLLALKIETTNPDYPKIAYHSAILNWKKDKTVPEHTNTNSVNFLEMLATDAELSAEERLEIIETWLINHMSLTAEIEKNAKQEIINLLGEYWVDKAKKYFHSKQPMTGVWALQNVPKNSKHYPTACYDIAITLHGETLLTKKLLDEVSVLEYVKPYVQIGVRLKDEESIQFYNAFYSSTTPLSDRIKAAMHILPLAVQQVCISRKAEQEFISKNSGIVTRFFSSVNSFFPSEQKQQAVELMNDGLAKFQQASPTDLLQVVKNFLAQVQKISTNFSPTKTNTIQPLITLKNQLENIIIELQVGVRPKTLEICHSQ